MAKPSTDLLPLMKCKAWRFVFNPGVVIFSVVHAVGMKGTWRRNDGSEWHAADNCSSAIPSRQRGV